MVAAVAALAATTLSGTAPVQAIPPGPLVECVDSPSGPSGVPLQTDEVHTCTVICPPGSAPACSVICDDTTLGTASAKACAKVEACTPETEECEPICTLRPFDVDATETESCAATCTTGPLTGMKCVVVCAGQWRGDLASCMSLTVSPPKARLPPLMLQFPEGQQYPYVLNPIQLQVDTAPAAPAIDAALQSQPTPAALPKAFNLHADMETRADEGDSVNLQVVDSGGQILLYANELVQPDYGNRAVFLGVPADLDATYELRIGFNVYPFDPFQGPGRAMLTPNVPAPSWWLTDLPKLTGPAPDPAAPPLPVGVPPPNVTLTEIPLVPPPVPTSLPPNGPPFLLLQSGNSPPGAAQTPIGPGSGTTSSPYAFSSKAADPNNDPVIIAFCLWDGSSCSWAYSGWVPSGTTASASLSWPTPGTKWVYAIAADTSYAWGAYSGWTSISITDPAANDPPCTPGVPSGPGSGAPGTAYTFATNACDPEGDSVRHWFCFWINDACAFQETAWVAASASAGVSHQWPAVGTYYVAAITEDSKGSWSPFSDWASIAISTAPGNSPPCTPSMPSGPATGNPNTAYSFSTSACDPNGDGVQYTFCFYKDEKCAYKQSAAVSAGSTASVSYAWAAPGTYYVSAQAVDSNYAASAWSPWGSITVSNPSNSPPCTPSVPTGPSSGKPAKTNSFSTSACDPDGDLVKYTFCFTQSGGACTYVDSKWVAAGKVSAKTHTWMSPGTYYVAAKATDKGGSQSDWSDWKSIVIAVANKKPNAASPPSGPATGVVGTAYTYTTVAKDPDGDTIQYQFDWSDGTQATTAPLASGTPGSLAHVWEAAGTYQLHARAQDSKGAWGPWSGYKTVTITAPNYAPNKPAPPAGPEDGMPNVAYNFTVAGSDPNGDDVRYEVSWGDSGPGTLTAFVPSGTAVSVSHVWGYAGYYDVFVRVQDEYGAWSEWSPKSAVTISLSECKGSKLDQNHSWTFDEQSHALAPGQPGYSLNWQNLTWGGAVLHWEYWPVDCPESVQVVEGEYGFAFGGENKFGKNIKIFEFGDGMEGANQCGKAFSSGGCDTAYSMTFYDPWWFVETPGNAVMSEEKLIGRASQKCTYWFDDVYRYVSTAAGFFYEPLGLLGLVDVPSSSCSATYESMTSLNQDGGVKDGLGIIVPDMTMTSWGDEQHLAGEIRIDYKEVAPDTLPFVTHSGFSYYTQGSCAPCGYFLNGTPEEWGAKTWVVETEVKIPENVST